MHCGRKPSFLSRTPWAVLAIILCVAPIMARAQFRASIRARSPIRRERPSRAQR